jgi:hypothetical protein
MFKRKSKWECSEVGNKRERSFPGAPDDSDPESLIPLSKYPHNQRLWAQDSFSLSLLGRMLCICLRFCNEHFTDQMTVLLHKGLEQDRAQNVPQIATRPWLCALPLVHCNMADGA